MLMTPDNHQSENTQFVCHSARVQSYRFIHKALRALMFRTLQQVASLDADDAGERTTMVAQVEELLQVCSDHLDHENRFFHSALRERAPRAVMPFDDDHDDHVGTIAQLRHQLDQVAMGGSAAAQHAYALYLGLTRFVGENLEHMAEEETTLTRTLWQHFSDDEIHALEGRLQASFAPQESAYYLRWMARSLNHAELATLMQGARAGMPAAAFAELCDLVRDALPQNRWARLSRTLGVQAVPGLATA
ncbi:MAG: hemerythrin domain-containing protein [Hydrogenophaga sp.]|uniref:hemerythrin domain-containing protein n=1 Tax=Hydrogenophaga sp. TaxID=1904254 RepID=UPI001D7E12F9|nr:hemerythrin domain-containing protein [Hydrogenophaga sp.]MBX3611616.1 hemerythrin domain-containing protein [Hydrogenophaga sp.]